MVPTAPVAIMVPTIVPPHLDSTKMVSNCPQFFPVFVRFRVYGFKKKKKKIIIKKKIMIIKFFRVNPRV
jgi:hypothetical protein